MVHVIDQLLLGISNRTVELLQFVGVAIFATLLDDRPTSTEIEKLGTGHIRELSVTPIQVIAQGFDTCITDSLLTQ